MALDSSCAIADQTINKLMNAAGDDVSLAALVTIALARLPYQQDEELALSLLFAIVFHDKLAETVNGSF